jgi:hypothetical protein
MSELFLCAILLAGARYIVKNTLYEPPYNFTCNSPATGYLCFV